MKLTIREKKMLYILLLVVIGAAFILLLQLFSSKIDAQQTELMTLKNSANNIRQSCSSIDDMEGELPGLQSSSKGIMESFYDIKLNREIDKIITSLAAMSGLKPVSLKVEDPFNEPIKPFITTDGEEVSPEDNEKESGIIWQNTAVLVAEGNEEQMKRFIDAVNNSSAMRINEFSFVKPNAYNEKLVITFGLSVYMFSLESGA
ncbi:MAG: hypothetical protein RR998_03635 [Oscillospiraceae bacterium]